MAYSAASSIVAAYGGSSNLFTTPETPFLKGFYSSNFVTERINSCAPYRVERIRKGYQREEDEGISPTDNHRRGALFCRTGVWLELLPFENEEDETSGVRIRGTKEESSKFSLVEFISVAMSLVSIRGVETKHFVCMDPSGRLYATPSTNYSTECVFVEDMMENYYNQYSSCAYGGRVQPWFIEIRKSGKPRKGASSKKRRKASHFIVVHHDLERLKHPHKPNGNDVTELVGASLFHRPPSRPLWRPHFTTKPPNPHRISNLRAKVEVAMDSAEKAKLLKEKRRRERNKKKRRREDRLRREEAKREERRQEIKRLREEELKNAGEVLRRYQLYKSTNRYGRPPTVPYPRVTRPPPPSANRTTSTTTVTPPRAAYPYPTGRPTYAPYNPYWEMRTTGRPYPQHHPNVPSNLQNPPNRPNPNPPGQQHQYPNYPTQQQHPAPNYHVHHQTAPNDRIYPDPQRNYPIVPVQHQQHPQHYHQNHQNQQNYPNVQSDRRVEHPVQVDYRTRQHDPRSQPSHQQDYRSRSADQQRVRTDPRTLPNNHQEPPRTHQPIQIEHPSAQLHRQVHHQPSVYQTAQQDPRVQQPHRTPPNPQPDHRSVQHNHQNHQNHQRHYPLVQQQQQYPPAQPNRPNISYQRYP